MAPPRVLLAALLHETNSFNRILTPLEAFHGRYLCLSDAEARSSLEGTGTEIAGFLSGVAAHGWHSLIPFAAAAGPSGPMVEADFTAMKTRLLAAEGPFDGALVALHGAMTTEASADPEGDLIEALRAKLGADVPIVVTLDMHANLSPRLVAAADGICIYETYPHVDQAETGLRAVATLEKLLALPRQGLRLTQALIVRPPMLDAADHGRTNPPGPMISVLPRLAALRARPGIISAGISIGFTWADTPNAGPAVVLHAPCDSVENLKAEGQALAEWLWESRTETQLHFPTPQEAMAEAGRAGDKPLILADFADNPAGGAYGDSVNLLRHMVDARLENAAFAALYDPEAAAAAHAAGEGAQLQLALGGRFAPDTCPPLTLDVTVQRLHADGIPFAGPYLRGVTVDMGPMAVLRHEGIEIIVASRALGVTDLNLFRTLGIEPTAKATLAIKSRNHHRAAFGPIARKVMLVDAGGIASMQLAQIDYRRLPHPIWPLDPEAGPEHIRTVEFKHHD